MSLRLLFLEGAIPRTTTREEWRKIDRWRRQTQCELAKQEADQVQSIGHLLAFGSVELAVRRAESPINPPLIIFPEPR